MGFGADEGDRTGEALFAQGDGSLHARHPGSDDHHAPRLLCLLLAHPSTLRIRRPHLTARQDSGCSTTLVPLPSCDSHSQLSSRRSLPSGSSATVETQCPDAVRPSVFNCT